MTDFKNYSGKNNRKNIIRFLTFILILFSYVTAQSQPSESIYGRLVDSNNGDGIPFATILVKDLGKGVISNAQGGFSIPKIIQNHNDTLIISCIGYKSRFVDLKSLNRQELNIINLNIAITELDEVMIKANKKIKFQSPYKIVKRSIGQIPTNYPNTPFSYIAYYRDYQKKSDTYINLNEALIENLDYGFHTCDQRDSKVRLLEYKVDSSFERDSNLEINYDNFDRKFIPDAHINPFGGNELTMLMIHDAIRNYEHSTYSFMYIMKESFLKNHRFDLTKVIEIEGGSLFVIDFKSKKTINDNSYQAIGQIFINRDTYAIHKLLYSLYKTQKKEKQLIFNTNVEYAKKQDLMYLNYISFNNVFKIPNPKDFATKEIVYNLKNKSISVKFNNPYSPIGILRRSNYKVKIDNKKVRINKIVQDSINNKVHIILDNITDFPEIKENDSTRLKIDFKNLTDIDGRKLNHRTYLTYNQYRELFVQQVHTNGKEKSISFIDKFLPLKDNSTSEYIEPMEYWMNTPLKK
ncbi:carboxypeptidase-like regulatory domain-containing protein [Ancylomarina sp. 16SWW S1-10-2]|uniref:carboxypeptidase-like regulatory domain-containing protein n=1 Tax=Ancylomarina sp. 16SWW S1-10-2 TaxID=2499681 RepID=UPI0012AE4254|nr:carboxypeptidase-like regulatory domain-containing protein [Ancylomarina sp. 16SWW S1-10-2]MRT94869.1 carboxypeptidase-like regulatory domain-containing protein [Ancylomarina sp. 16SWW S1-10-2]